MARCNPYGYATDAGPRHLMGGMYGPEYAGKQTLLKDGVHGPAVCERQAEGRYRMVCANGHTGPIMDLCPRHVAELQARCSDTCTRCVQGPGQVARGLEESMNSVMVQMADARARDDRVTLRNLATRLESLRGDMNELHARGLTPKVPLTLVEVS